MLIQYGPNKITTETKSILLDNKITTLIGENGSGKSAILEKIFENSFLHYQDKNIIAYSSGLNESFSEILYKKVDLSKKITLKKYSDALSGDLLYINSFFFSKNWAKLLIFLAYGLKNNGKLKNFLAEKLYISTDDHITIQYSLKIEDKYISDYNLALESGETNSLANSDFHLKLEKLIEKSFNFGVSLPTTLPHSGITYIDYDFSSKQTFNNIYLSSKDVQYIFSSSDDKKIINDKILTFLGLLTNNSYFLDINSINLNINSINLNDFSDGEFQLFVVYSLLDIFDGDNIIFLFDEVDSHLHYRNINKLWEILSSIKGKIITTTHIPDSIINSDLKQIRVVKDGIIDIDNTANSLINRLGNISDTYLYEKKVASKIEKIVLVDDCTDWFIFLELAKIKKGAHYNSIIEYIQPIKCNSGFNGNPNEIFGEKKLNWINEFILKNNSFNTKKVFSLCDKDECPIAKIDENMKFKEYHTGDNQKTQHFGNGGSIYYLSWKRREIENYFLSYTLLNEFGFLDEVNNELGRSNKLQLHNFGDNDSVRNFQAKEIIQKFAQKELNGKFVWKDYNDLREIISKIPKDEISEDIEKMYDFIISKI